MKLLFITREPHPTFRVDVRSLFGRHLPALGLSSTLVALRGPEEDEPWGGGQTVLCASRGPAPIRIIRHLLHDLAAALRLGSGHDAVQVRDRIVSGILVQQAARLRKRPFFYWMSFPFPEDNLLRSRVQGLSLGLLRWAFTLAGGLCLHALLYRRLLPRCDHIFVQSDAMADMLARRELPRSRMTVVPMGLDTDRLDAAVRETAPGGPEMVYLGGLDKTRQADFLLDVLALVRAERPQTELLLVGDAVETADREWFDKRVCRAGLEQAVHVTGWLPQEQAWQRAAAARMGLCALPPGPVFDTMSPTKAVELMAMGLPMVVSEHPDQGALVRDSGGGLVVPRDPKAFAGAVLQLLADPDQAVEMGRRGREHILSRRSYAVLASALAQRYEELLARPDSGKERPQ